MRQDAVELTRVVWVLIGLLGLDALNFLLEFSNIVDEQADLCEIWLIEAIVPFLIQASSRQGKYQFLGEEGDGN